MRRREPKIAAVAPSGTRRGRVLERVGQTLLVLSFAGLLVGGWAYHGARAQLSDRLMDLGGRMMVYAEARHQDAPRDLVLNGETLRFSSGTTGHTTQQVLDYYEARCAEVDGSLTQQMQALRDAHPEVDREVPRAPTMREDDGLRGYVACLDMGDEEVSLDDLIERIGTYGRTGDVAAIGEVRFVFAEQMGEGAERSTHFVTMWTEGSFDVGNMFPAEGDVPGVDVPGVPRPPATRRILESYERGEPQRLTVYEKPRTESELEGFYRTALSRDGWSLIEHPDGASPNAPRVLVAEHGDRMLTVVFQTHLETGSASAALFDAQ